ncbi:uncharacterized protein EAE98_000318 [Botrytis deweyae]|uniref:Velvet domain-containing protein n=1 Tax=Botrytis deweyae TaxID=2478750 RepID=A0ABQ7J2M0_9HELO|nr:uncharacterized protein EAE98_000318 [Botrytis deweyae]KAF7940191.1 hypothetical protein EAE98_000318 [Botrytis deweyae]
MGNNNNDTNTTTQPTLTGDQSSVIGQDRPLLFALNLDQNNNNSAANYAITSTISDALNPRNFGLELKVVGNEDKTISRSLPRPQMTTGMMGHLVRQRHIV